MLFIGYSVVLDLPLGHQQVLYFEDCWARRYRLWRRLAACCLEDWTRNRLVECAPVVVLGWHLLVLPLAPRYFQNCHETDSWHALHRHQQACKRIGDNKDTPWGTCKSWQALPLVSAAGLDADIFAVLSVLPSSTNGRHTRDGKCENIRGCTTK